VLWQTGRADEAMNAFRAAIRARPAYAQAHYMLGTMLARNGQVDEALAEFRLSLTYEPEAAEAHLSIARLLQQRNDHAGAEAAFAEAERLNTRKADAQAALFALSVGRQRLKQNDLPAALERLKEAALERQGDARAARHHRDEARRLDPSVGGGARRQ
jgi:tetratricopeptide (TPR) repeat protein